MPVTLKQATVGMANHTDQMVIDTIRRNSRLMDALTFDDAVAPGTGGSTLVYAYTQIKTPGKAGGRKLNEEYTPSEAERTTKTTNLVIMGGSYEIDRVIAANENRAIGEVAFQSEQKAIATAARYNYLAINGDASVETEFDGLKNLLKGTSNDFTKAAVDVSSTMTDAKAQALLEAVITASASIMGGKANLILCNTATKIKLQSAAVKLGYHEHSTDDFGNVVERFNGIELVDMGEFSDGATTKDVIETDSTTNVANVYLVRTGLDALHGITPQGTGVGLESHLPNFNEAGAVKKGDVEMVAGLALKNTRTCAVFSVKLA